MSGWIQDKKVVVVATVEHQPEHFSPRCNCNIPEAWLVECVNINEVCKPIGDFDHYQIYAYGNTKDEAILNFKAMVIGIFPQGGRIQFS